MLFSCGACLAELEVLCLLYAAGFQLNYTAVGCTRDSTHTILQCSSVGGVGSGFSWVVTVAGQASAPSANLSSYPAPSLYVVSGVGSSDADTQGGQTVVFNGLDFGPPALTALYPGIVSVTYGPVRAQCLCVLCCR